MGVFTFQNENTSTVAPARLYKPLVKDSDDLIPKAVEAIKSVEILEGNGGPGTIKKFTFVKGFPKSSTTPKAMLIPVKRNSRVTYKDKKLLLEKINTEENGSDMMINLSKRGEIR
uniref:Bet v I/Major latex protein domain-containing protein n=1 Tax=Cajanus cajan TaxID=3821 RepID=A0A151RXI1_CAJCA|nr:hypothetical protein KK1_031063 [Cajanus cajan]